MAQRPETHIPHAEPKMRKTHILKAVTAQKMDNSTPLRPILWLFSRFSGFSVGGRNGFISSSSQYIKWTTFGI